MYQNTVLSTKIYTTKSIAKNQLYQIKTNILLNESNDFYQIYSK